jgi:hypothetical protein
MCEAFYQLPKRTTLAPPTHNKSISVFQAGNIRLDEFDADTDVKQVIRDAAERNDGFIGDRRGVVTGPGISSLSNAPRFSGNRFVIILELCNRARA